MIITAEENEAFQELAKCFPDQIMQFATLSYTQGQSSQPLIKMMRENQLEKLVSIATASTESFQRNAVFCRARAKLLSNLVQSYNHPEPSVPMSKEEMDRQMREMGRDPEKAIYINNVHIKL
ncbi:MAG: hypothetical protein K2I72_02365 [Bacilli bacterium]|nr:hypothetical protein [Bacilli bacterium]